MRARTILTALGLFCGLLGLWAATYVSIVLFGREAVAIGAMVLVLLMVCWAAAKLMEPEKE